MLTVPAMEALARAYPTARLSALVSSTLAPLAQRIPVIDTVFQAPQGPRWAWCLRAFQLAAMLRRQKIDRVVLFNAVKELHLAVWLAGIPVRVGYDRKLGFLLNRRLKDERPLGACHEIESNWSLARLAGVQETKPYVSRLAFTDDADVVRKKLKQAGLSSGERFAALHPWASNPSKAWPEDRFLALAKSIATQTKMRVVFIGGAEHLKPGANFTHRHPQFIDLTGKLSLPELGALLKKACVLVSNDSGPVHVAALAGTPVVALFGTDNPGSHPHRWGPWGEGHAVIHKPLLLISPEEVFASVQPYMRAS